MSVAAMELGILKHPDSVNACCFSSGGNCIATGCSDSTIRIWSASTFSCLAKFHEQSTRVLFVTFLSGINVLVIECEHRMLITLILFWWADTSLLSVSDTEILLWKWKYPNNDKEESDPSYSVVPIGTANSSCCFQCATIAANRKYLAVATSKDNVVLYDIEQATQIFEFVGHTG